MGRHIFRHCIKGLLAHKCILLVTHALEFLPACDQVIVLEKGKIVSQGPFSVISQEKTGVLAALLQAQKEAQAQEAHETQEESPLSPVDVTPLTPTKEEEKETKVEDKEDVAGMEVKTEDKKKGELTVEETRVKGQVKRSVYSLYFMAAGGACIICNILLLYIIALYLCSSRYSYSPCGCVLSPRSLFHGFEGQFATSRWIDPRHHEVAYVVL